ncbi:MAG: hypothetical protein AAF466_09480, partial [Bacteroidota bacterium]
MPFRKLHIILLSGLFFFGTAHAAFGQQDCSCKDDLDFYFAEVKKLVSFKDQIKGKRARTFDETYQALRSSIDCSEDEFTCFDILNRLSYLVDDEHARLRSTARELTSKNFKEAAVIEAYRNSATFKEHPRYSINIDSLETALQLSPADQISGIYYKGSFKIAVFQPIGSDHFDGVVLDTGYEVWDRGQLVFRLLPNQKGRYQYYHAHLATKRWMAISNEYYNDGRLMRIGWKKDTTLTDHHLKVPDEKFDIKKLTESTSYIRLGSFGTGSSNRREAAQFLSELKK